MENNRKLCNLSELRIGQSAIVIKINLVDKKIKRHLLDMGLTIGVKVRVKKIPPIGDPIDIELRGYELAVRKIDLEQIEVEVIE